MLELMNSVLAGTVLRDLQYRNRHEIHQAVISYAEQHPETRLTLVISPGFHNEEEPAALYVKSETLRTPTPHLWLVPEREAPPAGSGAGPVGMGARTPGTAHFKERWEAYKDAGKRHDAPAMKQIWQELWNILVNEVVPQEGKMYLEPMVKDVLFELKTVGLVGFKTIFEAARQKHKFRYLDDHSAEVFTDDFGRPLDTHLRQLEELFEGMADSIKATLNIYLTNDADWEADFNQGVLDWIVDWGNRVHASWNNAHFLTGDGVALGMRAEGSGEGGLDGKVRGIPDQHNLTFDEAASMIFERLYGSREIVSRLGICLPPAKTGDTAYSDLNPSAGPPRRASPTIEYHDAAMERKNIKEALERHFKVLPEDDTLSVWVRQMPASGIDTGEETVIFVAPDNSRDVRVKTRLAVLDRARSLPVYVPRLRLDGLAAHLKALWARTDPARGVLARAALKRALITVGELALVADQRPLTVSEATEIREAIGAAAWEQDASLQELVTDPFFRLDGRPILAIQTLQGELYLPTGFPGLFRYRKPGSSIEDEMDVTDVDLLPPGSRFILENGPPINPNPHELTISPAIRWRPAVLPYRRKSCGTGGSNGSPDSTEKTLLCRRLKACWRS